MALAAGLHSIVAGGNVRLEGQVQLALSWTDASGTLLKEETVRIDPTAVVTMLQLTSGERLTIGARGSGRCGVLIEALRLIPANAAVRGSGRQFMIPEGSQRSQTFVTLDGAIQVKLRVTGLRDCRSGTAAT